MEEQAKLDYLNQIANLTKNENLSFLFSKVPTMTIEVFNKTVLYAATK